MLENSASLFAGPYVLARFPSRDFTIDFIRPPGWRTSSKSYTEAASPKTLKEKLKNFHMNSFQSISYVQPFSASALALTPLMYDAAYV
jgi:hypothetical protein